NGDRMHVTVLPARLGEQAHLTVDLVSRGREMDQKSWWLDADPIDYAHELGHQIGLRDEYRTVDLPHRPAVEGSLLGDHRAPAADGLRQGGLRERHLQLISSVVGHLDVPTGGGSHGRTWDEARELASPHDREHVWVDPVSAPHGTGSHEGGPLDVAPRVLGDDHLPPGSRRVIKQPGYASGDQFGISVALLNDANLHVMIARGPQTADGRAVDPKDKSREIEAFYRSIGIPADRIHMVDVPSMNKGRLFEVLDGRAGQMAEGWGAVSKTDYEAMVRDVTFASLKVSKDFSDELRERVREAWRMTSARDQQIADWLTSRGITLPAEGSKVLVLWSRFTGKATRWDDLSSRMEHDTSFQGARQILREFAREHGMVIITGDPHPSRNTKWDELVAEMREELGIDTIHHITGFWRDGGSDPSVWTENLRTGQLRLYDFLNRRYDMNHLGARSGNLEAAALLGHDVTYLEEVGSSGRARMERWHLDYSTGRAALGGKAPGYERVTIDFPPTASGKYTTQFDAKHGSFLPAGERGMGNAPAGKNEIQPSGTVDRGHQPRGETALWRKPVEVYAGERGFDYEALRKIRAELGLPGDRPLDAGQFAANRVQHLRNRYEKLRQEFLRSSGSEPWVEGYIGELDYFFKDKPEFANASPEQMYQWMVTNGLPKLPGLWSYHRASHNNALVAAEGYRIQDVPRDGDCLYNSVNQQLYWFADALQMRAHVTEWINQNRELVTAFATEHGSTFGDLRWMAQSQGWWAGSNGDLIPSIVASVLGVRLNIFDGVNWHPVVPIAGAPATNGEVRLFLSESHYSLLVSEPAPVTVPVDEGGQKRQLDHNSDSEPEDSAEKRLRPAPSGVSEESVVVNPLAVEHGGGMPVPGPLHERVQALEHLGPEARRELAADTVFVASLRSELSTEDFAQAAARLVIDVDPRVHQPVASRREAELQVARMLQDKEVAARLVAAGVRVVVVPRDVPLTGVAGFEKLRGLVAGGEAGNGRGVEQLRGANDELVVAIPEENLLGERTSVGPHTTQPEGYSSATHELAHAVLEFGLSREQRALVEEAYRGKRLADGLADLFGDESVTVWPDGSRRNAAGELVGNYSSADVHEFFA
ncbi:OTU domain-containing protein, partial [Kitasatospora sp. NPDC088264]|uniref:OTU domain-containing protein n=1 Tax=Kitasatospora sp. NPDC088264 TaxID=3155296 RepID=UPI00342C6796